VGAVDRLRELLDRQVYQPGEWCCAYGGLIWEGTVARICDKQRGHTDDHDYRGMSFMDAKPLDICSHCDRQVRPQEASIQLFDLHVPLCHPSDPLLPDCYRRVTIYKEPLGALRRLEDQPPGITAIQPGTALT
jgi:hypothetical protein